MIQSMTGFGSGENEAFRVEIRSTNQRFMEISFKVPQVLSQQEISLRNILKERFSRGRFDVFVSPVKRSMANVRINTDLAGELYNSLVSLKNEIPISGSVTLDNILAFKEMLMSEVEAYDQELLYEAFNGAVHSLQEMREVEGMVIAQDMLMRANLLDSLRVRIDAVYCEIADSCRERYIERFGALLRGIKYDENRLLQEAAVIAEKLDIREELTRISSHLAQIREMLSKGGSIGRKMEFILQELNREVNTIASKSDDYKIARMSIEMKAEIEKMREQAQNIQ